MSDTSRIRNFCIIAHIDHGKSTLADRLLEKTGTLAKRDIKDRVMDTLELEQERGITIKLQTARMEYEYKSGETRDMGNDQNRTDLTTHNSHPTSGKYILNLIDTPGHVDFSYEVSRSVAASEGALLLVDATQGVQAQTLSTMYKAMEYNLKVIPVLNKVDMDIAEVDRVKLEMMDTFGFDESEIILASGKTGIGVEEILQAIVERIPPPMSDEQRTEAEGLKPPTRALIYDSFFHEYKGVVALVKVVSGQIKSREKVYFIGTDTTNAPIELGYLKPMMVTKDTLETGEVGYIATGLKEIRQVHVGDTVTLWQPNEAHLNIPQLPGYQPAKPMVFASLYPVDAADFSEFQEALEKLALNDAALTYQRENSQALGTGFVCGFLGLLHLEIVQERLEREFNIDLISTSPTVEFKLKLATTDYSKIPNINVANIDENGLLGVRTAADFPEASLIDTVMEPWVKLEIFTPEQYVGGVMELCQSKRGIYKSMEFLNKDSSLSSRMAVITYEVPTLEIMVNFFDRLKSLSSGYASMDYSFLEYRPGDIVKVRILINLVEAEALSFLVHREEAMRRGRAIVEKLAEIIPRQQFKVPIQAAIAGNVLARADIQAYRKDVTAGMYGGDETRKKKLLNKQKKGKKKMKAIGKVEVPKEVFMTALKID
jgi:GTP-binding protein LepA